MLVLSRKTGERLVIGDQVEITVTQIGKGRVQIGIVAPKDVRIRRGELPPLPALAKRHSLGSPPAVLTH